MAPCFIHIVDLPWCHIGPHIGDVRRTEYETQDREAIERLLARTTHGWLAFVDPDGWPAVLAVNHVWLDGRLWFHGALEGRKMESLARDPRVRFAVADAFSIVPSHFRDPELACPATQYYESVMIKGRARFVTDPAEKARALQALMEKLQPEGGHAPIRAGDPLYEKSLATTAVTVIEPEEITGKFKFGQNLPERKRLEVAGKLEARGCPLDAGTAGKMRATVEKP